MLRKHRKKRPLEDWLLPPPSMGTVIGFAEKVILGIIGTFIALCSLCISLLIFGPILLLLGIILVIILLCSKSAPCKTAVS